MQLGTPAGDATAAGTLGLEAGELALHQRRACELRRQARAIGRLHHRSVRYGATCPGDRILPMVTQNVPSSVRAPSL